MKQNNMVRKTIWMTPKTYKSLHARAADLQVPIADVIRSLVKAYINGDITVPDTPPTDAQSAFHILPEDVAKAETLAKSQGYSFCGLVTALLENHVNTPIASQGASK